MADTLLDLTNEKELFGKRSLRSYIRQAFGAVSELPIFENKYYDLFKTPLDTFQERFPGGSEYGWRSDTEDWTEASQSTLYDLWRQTGAPNLGEVSSTRGGMAAPREMTFAYNPNKLQKILGYLFGTPQVRFGTKAPGYSGRASAGDLVSELAHQLMFENPQKYGSRRQQIAEMQAASRKGLTVEEELQQFYDKPGTQEYTAHSIVEPQILDWLRSISQ